MASWIEKFLHADDADLKKPGIYYSRLNATPQPFRLGKPAFGHSAKLSKGKYTGALLREIRAVKGVGKKRIDCTTKWVWR
jgi:hypothetical protein